ncbi:MAG TPA: response regulator transcription factor [Gaiellaceae bacterium]
MPIRVLLVDDEPMFLEALRALLEHDERIDVVATADSGEEAVELARDRRPDVALIDLAMPGLDGFELTRELVPATRVVAVSGLSSPRDAERALDAGASGFLLKGGLYNEIAEAIVAASREPREARA